MNVKAMNVKPMDFSVTLRKQETMQGNWDCEYKDERDL